MGRMILRENIMSSRRPTSDNHVEKRKTLPTVWSAQYKTASIDYCTARAGNSKWLATALYKSKTEDKCCLMTHAKKRFTT